MRTLMDLMYPPKSGLPTENQMDHLYAPIQQFNLVRLEQEPQKKKSKNSKWSLSMQRRKKILCVSVCTQSIHVTINVCIIPIIITIIMKSKHPNKPMWKTTTNRSTWDSFSPPERKKKGEIEEEEKKLIVMCNVMARLIM